MAEAALKQEYQYDNYAYAGYGAAERVPEDTYAPPITAPREREGVRAEPRERQATRGGVSLFAIVGFVFIALLVMVSIMWRIEISTINASIAGIPANGRRAAVPGLQQKIETLENEGRRLNIEYEKTFDLDEIQAYAIEQLGMTKPLDGGEVISARPADKAVIIDDGKKGEGGFIDAILEYFR